jgi:hypothetical protein
VSKKMAEANTTSSVPTEEIMVTYTAIVTMAMFPIYAGSYLSLAYKNTGNTDKVFKSQPTSDVSRK